MFLIYHLIHFAKLKLDITSSFKRESRRINILILIKYEKTYLKLVFYLQMLVHSLTHTHTLLLHWAQQMDES